MFLVGKELEDFWQTKPERWRYVRKELLSSALAKVSEVDSELRAGSISEDYFREKTGELVRLNYLEGRWEFEKRADSAALTIERSGVSTDKPPILFDSPFMTYNYEKSTEELVITINEDICERGIVLYVRQGAGVPRLHVILASGVRACLVEESVESGLVVPFSRFSLAEGSSLEHYHFSLLGSGVNLGFTWGEVNTDSSYKGFSLLQNGYINRQESYIDLRGERSSCRSDCIYFANQESHVEKATYVGHNAENTRSQQVIRGLIEDHGRGIFQGKLYVQEGAQKTDGYQHHASLVLGDKAISYAKPELEIYADDVKCSHGSTSGSISEEQLFYLRARGIGEDEARYMLQQAFLEQAIVEREVHGEFLRSRVRQCLGRQ